MTVPISASLQVAQPAPLPVPPQTARFQEKRDTLLAAAARHFNQQGVKGATLGDIAASVGLVTTSLTYYYRKKEDLATACFLRAIVAHESLALAAGRCAPTVASPGGPLLQPACRPAGRHRAWRASRR
jgi:AcrR family transcriptional regulator